MSKTTINDSRIRISPSKKLLEFINTYKDDINELPANIAKALTASNYELTSKIEILEMVNDIKPPTIDLKLLATVCSESKEESTDKTSSEKQKTEANQNSDDAIQGVHLYLSDLCWLRDFLARTRKEHGNELYLHDMLDLSALLLPENEIIERNPVLEARCQKLREQQQNREYLKMTKNVDNVLKNFPEDTIAYQMKALNKQIIAVFQFVLSVVAGFVFGFLGLELIIGGLDFGLRLLLGIMFALIIALAEIYFLAKKLNEYDEITTTQANFQNQSPTKNRKVHTD